MALEGGSLLGVMTATHRDMRARQAGSGVRSAIDRGNVFTSLPRDSYVSPELFDIEMQKVFSRQWLYAGQLSQLREPGSYYVRELGPESLIIARDLSGKLRAFFNVCRHRGSRLCAEGEAGKAKQFICPYHQWNFQIDGTLRAVPGMRDGKDFDFKDYPLHEAYIDSFFGSIFVYLDKEPPKESLRDYLIARTTDLDHYAAVQPERTKLAFRKVYHVRANWKILMENNAECYHCPATHPTLSMCVNMPASYLNDDGEMDPAAAGGLFPFNPGMKTLSGTGEFVCRKLLGEGNPAQFSVGLITFPNFCGISYFADYGAIITVEPIDKDNTRLITEWVVHEDAVEGVDYDIPSLIKGWDQTNLEDISLSENTYAGARSLRFEPGPNNIRREGMIRYALLPYFDLMEA